MCGNPSHFRLPALKVLSARMLFYDLEPRLTGGNYEALNLLAENVQNLSRQLSNQLYSAHTETLGEALLRTSDALGRMFRNPGLQYLDYYQRAVSEVKCSDCSAPRPPCRNTWRDSDIVHAGGRCVQPLKHLFEHVSDFSRKWYAAHLTSRAAPKYDLELSTGPPSGARPHDFDVPYLVNGEAHVHDSTTFVKLLLHPEQFDRETYRACLYVLFHEIVCHGFQGLVTNGSGERVAVGSDEFAEGWMDWVAFRALESFLSEPPEKCTAVHTRDAENTQEIARRFHKARHDPSHPHGNTKTFLDGVETAKKTQQFIEDLVLLKLTQAKEPDVEFLRLSVDLNVERTTISERRRFMRQIRLAMEHVYGSEWPEEEMPGQIAACKVTRPFQRYLERKSTARELLDDVLIL